MSVTFFHRPWRLFVNLVFVLGVVVGRADAAAPRVAIDAGTIVECLDVTSREFASAHPEERIIEAKFRLSVLIESGHEQELEQLQVAIDSPERRIRVVDFQPRTELASELAGDVEVCNTADTVQSLNASLGGVVSADHGPAHVQASPAAGVGVTQNRGSKESYRRLPPKQLVLSSGTTNAEHGVFFKWRRSSQFALEGLREVTVRFRVPHDWTGDWVQLDADVLGRNKNYFGEKVEPCGQARFYVGLYQTGDSRAQQAALAVATAQVPGSAPNSAGNASGGQRHVAYKPVQPNEPRKSQEWFAIPSVLKLCNHEHGVPATGTDLPTALQELSTMSGTGLIAGGR